MLRRKIIKEKTVSIAAYTDEIEQCYISINVFGYRQDILFPKCRMRAGVHYGIYCLGKFIAFHWGSGRQTYWEFPWNRWQFVRHTVLNDRGEGIASLLGVDAEDYKTLCDAGRVIHFTIRNRRGVTFSVDAFVEEREYRRGMGWWRWLQFFHEPIVERQLAASYSGRSIGVRSYFDIPLSPKETIPHAIWQFCLTRNLEFLPEKYYVD